MNAAAIVTLARDAGIRISTDGTDLILDAVAEPNADILDLIAGSKTDILRFLRRPVRPADWGDADWHTFFSERAAEAELQQGMSRRTAEEHAFLCCLVGWVNSHPVTSAPGRCVWCGDLERAADAVILPFGCSPGRHAWLHSICWRHWQAKREAEAVAALAAMGVVRQAQDAGEVSADRRGAAK